MFANYRNHGKIDHFVTKLHAPKVATRGTCTERNGLLHM